MSDIEITNVTANAKNWTVGEIATVKFTLKNASGSKITKLRLYLHVTTRDFTQTSGSYKNIILKYILGKAEDPEYHATVSIANGASKTYSTTFVITNDIVKHFQDNPNTRAVPIYVNWNMNGGSGGSILLSEDLNIINCRFEPNIRYFSLERAKAGQRDDEGENILADLILSIAETGFDYTKFIKAYIRNVTAQTITDVSDRMNDLLAGVTDSADLIPGTFPKESDWTFEVVFGDEFESVTFDTTLLHSFANLHLSGQPTGGACFGGFSSSEYGKPKLESHYPGYFYRGINGVNIFSEGEVLTGGRWVDNKPIYRKAIKLPAVAKDTSSTTGIIQVDPDIGHLLDYYGVVQRENGYWYPLNFRSLSNSAYQVDCYIDADGYVVLRTGSSMALNGGYMICYYTKASDAAIEDDDGVAALVDETGATVADSAGVAYSVRAYNADVYQSQYSGSEIDSGIARALVALPLGGGTMTGPLILSGDPTVPFGAVTKQFLENELKKIELTPGAGVVNITITEVV